MILFPYLSFVIETDLSVKETMELIIEYVSSTEKTLAGYHSKSKFKGSFSGNSFKFQRIIKYRNSFLPVIRGQINSTGPTTEVSIRMVPGLNTTIYVLFWLVIAGQLIYPALFGEYIETSKLVFAVVIILFGYVFMTAGFGYEAYKAEQELMGIFGEREIRNKSVVRN